MNGLLFTLAAAMALALLIVGRMQLDRARERYIDHYDYARLLDARLAGKRPELGARQRQQVFRGLADYFQLCRAAGPHGMVSMPSQVVDDAWHEFILFTRNYEHFCQRALGRFLHHVPAETMRQPTRAQEGIQHAWQLACRREGINPVRPTRLPLLFALDRELGIADGFHYALDCSTALARSDGNRTIYCASHIRTRRGGDGGGCGAGCGSGCSGDSRPGDSAGDGGGGGCGGD